MGKLAFYPCSVCAPAFLFWSETAVGGRYDILHCFTLQGALTLYRLLSSEPVRHITLLCLTAALAVTHPDSEDRPSPGVYLGARGWRRPGEGGAPWVMKAYVPTVPRNSSAPVRDGRSACNSLQCRKAGCVSSRLLQPKIKPKPLTVPLQPFRAPPRCRERGRAVVARARSLP